MSTTARTGRGAPGPVTTFLVHLLATRPGAAVARGLCVLRYTARDGREITLPVASVRGAGMVVIVGNAATKTWWRHFPGRPRDVEVTVRSRWTRYTGRLLEGSERAAALAGYRGRHQPTPVADTDEVVALSPVEPGGGTATASSSARAQALWRRWFAWVSLGEFIGFIAPAVVGAVSTAWPLPAAAAGVLLAGAVEGTALGWAQAHVLSRKLPRLPRRRFVVATAGAAVLAYAIGLVPMAAGERLTALPVAALISGGLVGGACLLATIGTAQWLVLRKIRARCAWWIATTGAAWAGGLLVFTWIVTPLWQPGQPLPLTVAIGVLGGAVMAAAVAALTGLAAVRLTA